MPGIGFFAPLPLAMMMPFMAGQSMIMGDAFGKAYQYGKRKISAMSNEEFNKLTPEDLAKTLQTDYMSMIPSLKASVAASRDFQSFIIVELGRIIKELPSDVINAFGGNETGQKSFADIQPPPNYQPPQKHELIIKVEQMLSGAGGSTSNNLYGIPDDLAANAELSPAILTQEDYGITENLPKTTDAPITLTSLSDAQIKDAYSDMLSNRITLSSKNKQLLTLEYKKRFSTSLKDKRIAEANALNVEATIQTTAPQQEHQTWHNKKMKLMQDALNIKKGMGGALFVNGKNAALLQSKVKRHEAAQKLLQNHLQLGRNSRNNLIRAEANNGWNNRIWKLV